MKQKMFIDAAEETIKENKYVEDIREKQKIITTHFLVDEEKYKIIKRDKGDYYTISFSELNIFKKMKMISKEVETVLKQILKKYDTHKTTLIIGLGNSSIDGDSIGPATTNKIIATNHYEDFLTIPKVALFNPEVISKTGISSFNIIKMLVANLSPDTIIIIDSLATTTKTRLNTCIEINDTGIIPGSAIRENKKITAKTFNIPVITVGVPLLIDYEKELYTSPNVKQVVEQLSDIISGAINSIYFQ